MGRFIVIDCEDSQLYAPHTFGSIFQSQLERDGDQWTLCPVACGESLPSDILDYDGVVITGSHYNCRDEASLPWFAPLVSVIRQIADIGRPRLYGGCYGCQIIAHALGGVVDYNPNGRFLLMAEHVKVAHHQAALDDSLPISPEIIAKLRSSEGLNLLVSHGDCVRQVPDNSILLAASDSCATEMYLTGKNHNIWACQSHPEFQYEFAIRDRIWPSIVGAGRLSKEEEELYMATFLRYTGKDAELMMTAISDFLHGSTTA